MGRRLTLALIVIAVLVAVFWKDNDAGRGEAELTVDSRPQGAQVWLDDRPIGVTPVTQAPLQPGPHQVRLLLNGYAPISQTVELKEGDRRFLELNLSPPPRPNQKA